MELPHQRSHLRGVGRAWQRKAEMLVAQRLRAQIDGQGCVLAQRGDVAIKHGAIAGEIRLEDGTEVLCALSYARTDDDLSVPRPSGIEAGTLAGTGCVEAQSVLMIRTPVMDCETNRRPSTGIAADRPCGGKPVDGTASR